MDSLLEFRDHLGPLKIILLYNPTKGLQAIVTEVIAFQQIEDKIRRNTTLILERSRQTGQMPRQVALAIAEQRGQAAMAHQETLHVPNFALMT